MSPQILDEAFRKIDFDRDLVYKFFITFSLFEKALKETEFCKVNLANEITPDWDSFATSIDGQFSSMLTSPNHQELKIAVNYLLGNPTKKQVYQDNRIQFIETERSSNSISQWLSVLIRRVRNNLFHGAKFAYDRPRDTLLIQNSLIILEEWAVLNPKVRRNIKQVKR